MSKVLTGLVVVLVLVVVVAAPVLAGELVSPPVELNLNVTYPIELYWALGSPSGASGNYTQEVLRDEWSLGVPKYLWLKSACADNLTGLYLNFEASRDAFRVESLTSGYAVTYDSGREVYVVAPAGGFNFTGPAETEQGFKITPLARGRYYVRVYWTKED